MNILYDGIVLFDFDSGEMTVRKTDGSLHGDGIRGLDLGISDAVARLADSLNARDEVTVKKIVSCAGIIPGRHKAEEGFDFCTSGADGREVTLSGTVIPLSEKLSCFCYKSRVSTSDGTDKPEIRTFGYFDIFVDSKPVVFSSKKAKELLALLVDRNGGFVNFADAMSVLWQGEEDTPQLRTRFRKTAMFLSRTLEENGISDIIECINGKRRIIPEKVSCDFYRFLSDRKKYASEFSGAYLTGYPWAKKTLPLIKNR